jgi:hypothetical protein
MCSAAPVVRLVVTTVLASAIGLAAVPLGAQESLPVPPAQPAPPAAAYESALPGIGSRVRVRSLASNSDEVVGRLTAIEIGSLTVESTVVARSDISRLELSMRPSRKGKGAWIGFGSGVAVAFLGMTVLAPESEASAFWGLIYGGGLGAVGALVGAAVAPGEQWKEVPLHSLRSSGPASSSDVRLTLGPARGRGLSASVAWSW